MTQRITLKALEMLVYQCFKAFLFYGTLQDNAVK
jgi:hypothetical protein